MRAVPDVPDRKVVGFFIAPEQEQSGAERIAVRRCDLLKYVPESKER
jgi:hypothetical protein